jgi:4-amino-4-deoxy-L-arabinose transferase-like glycosyltransferase
VKRQTSPSPPNDRKIAPTRQDWIAVLVLTLAGLAAGAAVAWGVFERVPHLEDEITYLFQARTLARGALWAPAPPVRRAFFAPFVLVYGDKWIGKYPPGWPALLALGELVGAGWLVNPALGGLAAALTYWLGRDLFGREVGALAGTLTVTSPMFLILCGSLMSHPAALVMTLLFALAYLRADRSPGWAALGGAALGAIVLIRPLTAVCVGLPFVVYSIVRLARHPRSTLVRLWPMIVCALLVAALYPAYLYALTGNPTINLYTLWWPYDRVGFGPGIGPHQGHTLRQAFINARADLRLWVSDLFGWPGLSWVFILPGFVAAVAARPKAGCAWPWLLFGTFPAFVAVHLAYWVGARAYSTRYYYEALPALTILSAVGLAWLARRLKSPAAGAALLAGLLCVNVAFYLPGRFDDLRGLYGITRAPLEVLAAHQRSDALVIVRAERWLEYSALLAQNSPWLDGPLVVARDVDPATTAQVLALYPERQVLYFDHGKFVDLPPPPAPAQSRP